MELDVDLDVDLDITVDNIMQEIDELDISVFNSTIQTSQPTVFQEPIISPELDQEHLPFLVSNLCLALLMTIL